MSVKRSGKMRSLPAKVENGVKEGLILGGDLIAQRAQRKARVKTGRLKRSIMRGNPKKLGNGRMVISIGTNVEYAMAQEFGVGANAEDPSKSKVPERRGNKPHPYLRPAIQESRREVISLISKRILSKLIRL
jgi:HK97 gp10 family phage protein